VARLDRKRPDLYLMPLKDGQPLAELYTLKKDHCAGQHARGCTWPKALPAGRLGGAR
jgi:hypothetical protein